MIPELFAPNAFTAIKAMIVVANIMKDMMIKKDFEDNSTERTNIQNDRKIRSLSMSTPIARIRLNVSKKSAAL